MRHLFIICMALFPLLAMGQSYSLESDKPFWTKGYFKEMDNSYLEVVSAFGYDLEEARSKAVKEVIGRRSLATGTEANVVIRENNVSVQSEHELIVKARIIDEYAHHTTGGYTVYLLVQTAKNPTFKYESVTLTNDYKSGARPLLPGMAQLYKGSKGKAAFIIGVEALSIASIILCENQHASYRNKIMEQPRFAKEYSNKADNWETGRNISIGVAAGIYVYNIIDGFVAKGKKRIVTGKPNGGGLSVVPFATPSTAGMAFAYRF